MNEEPSSPIPPSPSGPLLEGKLPEDFGPMLRFVRECTGVSQRTLAERIGVHHTLISHWEDGRRIPPPNRLLSMVRTLRDTGSCRPADLHVLIGRVAISDHRYAWLSVIHDEGSRLGAFEEWAGKMKDGGAED